MYESERLFNGSTEEKWFRAASASTTHMLLLRDRRNGLESWAVYASSLSEVEAILAQHPRGRDLIDRIYTVEIYRMDLSWEEQKRSAGLVWNL